MNSDVIILIILLAPIAFLVTAITSWFQTGLRPRLVKNLALGASTISILTAAVSGFFVMQHGLVESATLGVSQLGFSLRLDVISILMFAMIAVIAFVVMRFSLNYLDGDARQGRFLGRLSATIACVQMLVLAGNLGLLLIAWILTSHSLHRLLVFYKERPGAVIAARKKFIAARLGDASLLAAVTLLYFQFGTGNMEVIFQEIKSSFSSGMIPIELEMAAIMLALAAIVKSAQFPTHGWLIEVMETPTPVSALLHAGLLNAGPFLIIRMAYVMEVTTFASILIIAVGGFTALFASLSFLTQTSVKTALGYSSVAHMGFSLMVCGLGVFPAAMLHLVAHSFYKAHSFLSSGSVIDQLRASKVTKTERVGSPAKIALSIALAVGIYSGVAFIWGINPADDLALLAIGAIIVMGLSTLFASALDSNGSMGLVIRAAVLAITVAIAFFTLELGFHLLLASQLPEAMGLTFVELGLTAFILLAFATVVFAQILAPTLSDKPVYRALAIHIRNGLYANALFDQLIGSLRVYHPEESPLELENAGKIERLKPIGLKSYKEQTT